MIAKLATTLISLPRAGLSAGTGGSGRAGYWRGAAPRQLSREIRLAARPNAKHIHLMVEGLSRSSRLILWASLFGMIALAWAFLFGLQYVVGWALPPAISWAIATFGSWPLFGLVAALIVGSFYTAFRIERRRKDEEYARDKTIHVERPNWWQQPLGRTRIPRLVWYYVGIIAVVMLFGFVVSLPR